MNPGITSLISKAERLHRAGRLREAEDVFSSLLKTHGGDPVAVTALAMAATRMGESEAGLGLFRRAALLAPGEAAAHYNLGKALAEAGRRADAVAAYRQAIRLNPGLSAAHYNLGNALADLGRADEAVTALELAVKAAPNDVKAWSNLLMSAHYKEVATAKSNTELAQGYERALGGQVTTLSSASRSKSSCVKIGFVSPDLGSHPVGHYLLALLPHLDRSLIRVYAYSDRVREDEIGRELKSFCDGWIRSAQMDDGQLARRIRSDGIDILIDLAGHTARGRLPVFARKPAPLQIAWCGYVATTGLKAMDAIIADRFHIPEGEEEFYVERVIRLPHSWLAWTPPKDAPLPAPPPSSTRRAVTLGSFNNPAKYSNGLLRLWGSILNRLPEARLLLKASLFSDATLRDDLRSRFQSAGGDAARLVIEAGSPHRELLEAYGNIDVALDTFPYSGGVTTLEALWMGVPVVTKPGDSFASRHTTSFLTTSGFPELIAKDEADYADKVAALAGDAARLAEYRHSLRPALAASPLCDGTGFARAWLDAVLGLAKTVQAR